MTNLGTDNVLIDFCHTYHLSSGDSSFCVHISLKTNLNSAQADRQLNKIKFYTYILFTKGILLYSSYFVFYPSTIQNHPHLYVFYYHHPHALVLFQTLVSSAYKHHQGV